MTIHEYIL